MSLFDTIPGPNEARFAGDDYDPAQDDERLRGQIGRIHALMSDHRWRTVEEIREVTGDPAASILAQLGHLRKERFGSYLVEKRSRGERSAGLYEYRVGGKGEGVPRPRQARTPAHEAALRAADEMVPFLRHSDRCLAERPLGGCVCGLADLRRRYAEARSETRRTAT